ncbi:MAG: response regulator [Candidatus Eisenbacteria bacterium]|nr:response regulator [Candidatus Eisenbacteria bacterium]
MAPEKRASLRKILIVDDDVAVTNYLMVFLMQTERFETTVVNDSREVSPLLDAVRFDLILLDMDMPHVSGMDILKEMRSREIKTPVIVLTGVSDVDLAVRSMKLGAFDYLTKPVEEEHLLEVIDSALAHRELQHSIEQLPEELTHEDLAHQDAFARIPTKNAEMVRLLHQAERLAASDLSIFLSGERGTGKEMLARAIHNASPVRTGPFVVVDVEAIAPEQFPAAFFGQAAVWSGEREERPGFLEEAEKGTLYLCRIERLSHPMQIRLQRVLQTGEYYRENSTQIRKAQVRFIVSSALDLTGDEHQERFSRDLLYHLMVNSLHLPPLRERPEDLPLLIEDLSQQAMAKFGKEIEGFSETFLAALRDYAFPDNIQELRNIVESAIVNTDTKIVGSEALPRYLQERVAATGAAGPEGGGFGPRPMAEMQRDHVLRTLRYCDDDRERAARRLGISTEELGRILGE